MPQPRRSRPTAAALAFVVLVSACTGSPAGDTGSDPLPTVSARSLTAREAVEGFLAAWADHDWDAMADYVGPASAEQAVEGHRVLWSELRIESTVIEAVDFGTTGNAGRAIFTVRATPELMGEWTYQSSFQLLRESDGWFVDWTPQTAHPSLFEGRAIQRVDEFLGRGRILDRSGVPLRSDREVRSIGLVPGRIEDFDTVLETLVETLEVDADKIRAEFEAPGVQPDWFVPAKTLTVGEFEAVWDDLRPIPGVVYQVLEARQSADPDLAAHILGTVGPITAEQLERWGDPYRDGATVGRSGLELAFEAELRGNPRAEIRAVDRSGNLLSVLISSGDLVPSDLVTTLDYEIQTAVERALEGVELPSAMVVVDVATGEIRGSASRPIGEFDRALAGLYPPGSTFKTVTTAAGLADGMTPSSRIDCPGRLVAGGYPITNHGNLALGEVSMLTAYAQSCNTAYAAIGTGVGAEAMGAAASAFGFDVPYYVGLNTAGGLFPDPVDTAELAAASIGQGRVQASPLHMASVAAAVAGGSWHQPTLIEAREGLGLPETAPPSELGEGVAEALRQMMQAVVDNGTGRAAAVAGVPVAGKTGSAEFGDDEPPQTHAWFIGYSGELAFAVLVEGGGAGGGVAAPIASRFLAGLAQ